MKYKIKNSIIKAKSVQDAINFYKKLHGKIRDSKASDIANKIKSKFPGIQLQVKDVTKVVSTDVIISNYGNNDKKEVYNYLYNNFGNERNVYVSENKVSVFDSIRDSKASDIINDLKSKFPGIQLETKVYNDEDGKHTYIKITGYANDNKYHQFELNAQKYLYKLENGKDIFVSYPGIISVHEYIRDSIKDVDIDEELEKYKKTDKYNNIQLQYIKYGLENHLDISKYADPKFNAGQMEEIIDGLKEHLDVSKYADPKFNSTQMQRIKFGLRKHLDVSKYADPKFDYYQMDKIRQQLEEGTYKDSVRDVNIDKELEKYEKTGKFNTKQMEMIKYGLQEHVDVSKYANPIFDDEQMEEIKIGLQHHIDISKYNNPSFDWSQMNQIRRGLENHIDVSKYADPRLTNFQMKEIREKLEKGTYKDSIRDVDIDKYQEWVDYDMKHYGHISDKTNRLIKEAGLEIVKDIHGDYEVIAHEDNGYRKDSKFKDKRYDANLIKQDLENAINKYFTNDKEMLDYTDIRVKEDSDKITIEVGAELYYGQMEKLAKYLDRIIKDYDRDAYFDHDDPGLISAFIWKK